MRIIATVAIGCALLGAFVAGCPTVAGCTCFWEGGQFVEVREAVTDGDRFGLELRVQLQPCCENPVNVERSFWFDFADYDDGVRMGELVAQVTGTPIDASPEGAYELSDLGFRVEPDGFANSHLLTHIATFNVVSLATGETVGTLNICGGHVTDEGCQRLFDACADGECPAAHKDPANPVPNE